MKPIKGAELKNSFPFNLQFRDTEKKTYWKIENGDLRIKGYLVDEIKINDTNYDFLEWIDQDNFGVAIGFRKIKNSISKGVAIWFIGEDIDNARDHSLNFIEKLKSDRRIKGNLKEIRNGIWAKPLAKFLGITKTQLSEQVIGQLIKAMEVKSTFSKRINEIKNPYPRVERNKKTPSKVSKSANIQIYPQKTPQNQNGNPQRSSISNDERSTWNEFSNRLKERGWKMEKVEQKEGKYLISFRHKKINLLLQTDMKQENYDIVGFY